MENMENQLNTDRGSIMYLIMVCLVATLGGLLFGYDTAVISGAIGFLQTRFEMSAELTGFAAASALAGCVIGVYLAGILNDTERLRSGVPVAAQLVKSVKQSVQYGLICMVAFDISAVFLWLISRWLGDETGGIVGNHANAIIYINLGWLAASALLGVVACLLGSWIGRKEVMIMAAVFFLISAIGTALPKTLFQFVIFRIIGGIGVGAASMTSPMYIAEISPAKIRGRMVSLNQFAIIFGMLVVYFVNYYIADHGIGKSGTDEWNVLYGWRWMFGSESLPAILLLVLLFFVPESPRWLAKQGRDKEAFDILTRVGGTAYAKAEIAEIDDTLAHEESSIGMLFHKGFRIAFLIGVVLAVLQQVTGINVFLYYAPEIFKKLSNKGTDVALMQTIVVGAVNLTFTVLAIWTVDKLGRKALMIVGSAGMGISLFAMGMAAYLHDTGVWVLVFILGYIACFALSVGPVTWVILSEIFPTKIRGRAMAIATVCLWTANYVVSQTFPMMNDNKQLVETFNRGFPFFLYGLMCVITVVFVWRCVPETKGKSLEQIEKHWFGTEQS